ncbi:MAG TPA: CdaR family protein [Vicinamibacterales bacterium]|jgi:YbbR domain-containing protein
MVYHPFRHLGLKFLAIAIAVALWFTVAGERTVERSLRVPLELQNMPEQLELIENPPATVEVRIRGASGTLSTLGTGDVVGMVDLSSARAGRRLFHLTTSHVRAPFGVEVAQVTPSTVSLLFERSGTRRVPVVPVVEGEPAPGYVAGPATSDPIGVDVVGPESALGRLKEAMTEPISISGAKRRVRETVTVGIADAGLRLKSAANAVVTIDVYPAPIDRTLAQVPVHLRGVGLGLSGQVFPATLTVTTQGPKDVLESLQADSLLAFVDLAGLGPGRYNLPVRVEPRQGFLVLRVEPATVRVRIK